METQFRNKAYKSNNIYVANLREGNNFINELFDQVYLNLLQPFNCNNNIVMEDPLVKCVKPSLTKKRVLFVRGMQTKSHIC